MKLRIGYLDGNCWPFRFHRLKYSTTTYYIFWRLFVAIEKA